MDILSQIIPGILLPGNPIANMVFKSYAIQTLIEATSFTQDLKLGHYVKVPPRATFIGAYWALRPRILVSDSFTAQAVGTIMAAFVEVGVKQWMFNNVRDICQPHQKDSLTCPHNQVFFTASAVWYVIPRCRDICSRTQRM